MAEKGVSFDTNLKGLNELVIMTDRGEQRFLISDEEAECLAWQIVDKTGMHLDSHPYNCDHKKEALEK